VSRRSLSTITPIETVRLLRRYLALRKDEAKVYGVRENDGNLCYWSLSKRDANKKAEQWGLGTSELLGKTNEELGAIT